MVTHSNVQDILSTKRQVCNLFQNLWNRSPWYTKLFGNSFLKERMVEETTLIKADEVDKYLRKCF